MRQAVEHHNLIVEKNRLLADFQATNAKLIEANRLKGAFIEVASHELNTPVTVVLGMIELWKMSQTPSASPIERKWVDRIGAAAGRLARTVERMLKLVRNREFGQSLDDGAVDLEPMVRRAVEELSPYLELRQPDGGRRDRAGFRARSRPTRSKIADVLINLLANAIKFTPDGGTIRVEARAEPRSRDWVRVQVSDQGAGVAPATSSTSSSRSSPASTRSATRRANTSSASAASAWGCGWSRRSSSCTAAASKSPACPASARPSRSCCRDRGATRQARCRPNWAFPTPVEPAMPRGWPGQPRFEVGGRLVHLGTEITRWSSTCTRDSDVPGRLEPGRREFRPWQPPDE